MKKEEENNQQVLKWGKGRQTQFIVSITTMSSL